MRTGAAIYAWISSEQQREANTIWKSPKEWAFEDERYSGATLERPGLERVMDLAAEGHIQVVLAYAPDRLGRKYAYQILLIEELTLNESRRYLSKHHSDATPIPNRAMDN